jgi:hypothetical protein
MQPSQIFKEFGEIIDTIKTSLLQNFSFPILIQHQAIQFCTKETITAEEDSCPNINFWYVIHDSFVDKIILTTKNKIKFFNTSVKGLL